eukprot:TRINITY_DN9532_c0_g1_i2.p2 TRINITY_DN9532_c0_g1~~TRINITY_DN9532_c0_g1_i2.p2  ORF type:complete len:203 (-),score=29.30 TRINITY_DN9532_c0_g1_i2:270-878(-)
MEWYTKLFPLFLPTNNSFSGQRLYAESTTYYLYHWHVKVSRRALDSIENYAKPSEKALEFVENLIKTLEETIKDNFEIGEMLCWGQVHQQKYEHPVFKNSIGLNKIFSRYAQADGGKHTINVASPDFLNKNFMSIHSANYRQIIDMNYDYASYYIIDTGISENIFSLHYDDQMQLHSQEKYIEMVSGFSQIKVNEYSQIEID